MRQRPFGIAGEQQGLPLRVFAPHLGEWCIDPCMGLPSDFIRSPSPTGWNAHRTDHCLSPSLDRDALDPDRLFAIATVSLQRLNLSREGSGQFIERSLGTLLLRKVLHVCQAPRECHGRQVHSGHLHGEHSLDFIPRFDPIDDRKHEIDPRLIGLPPLARNIGDLAQQAIHERKAGRTERVQKIDRSRAEIGMVRASRNASLPFGDANASRRPLSAASNVSSKSGFFSGGRFVRLCHCRWLRGGESSLPSR